MGGFQAGYAPQDYGTNAEENYTGGVSGAAPEVPLLPGQSQPFLHDPSGGVGVGVDVGNAFSPSTTNNNVHVYLEYTAAGGGVQVNSFSVYNNSNHQLYIKSIIFTFFNFAGKQVQSYTYSPDTPLIASMDYYYHRIKPKTIYWQGLAGTKSNPKNAFRNGYVKVSITFRDPDADPVRRYQEVKKYLHAH